VVGLHTILAVVVEQISLEPVASPLLGLSSSYRC